MPFPSSAAHTCLRALRLWDCLPVPSPVSVQGYRERRQDVRHAATQTADAMLFLHLCGVMQRSSPLSVEEHSRRILKRRVISGVPLYRMSPHIRTRVWHVHANQVQ